MENLVHEADRRTLVRILLGQLNMNTPDTALERSFTRSAQASTRRINSLTLCRTLEFDVEFGHAIIDEIDIEIRHQAVSRSSASAHQK